MSQQFAIHPLRDWIESETWSPSWYIHVLNGSVDWYITNLKPIVSVDWLSIHVFEAFGQTHPTIPNPHRPPMNRLALGHSVVVVVDSIWHILTMTIWYDIIMNHNINYVNHKTLFVQSTVLFEKLTWMLIWHDPVHVSPIRAWFIGYSDWNISNIFRVLGWRRLGFLFQKKIPNHPTRWYSFPSGSDENNISLSKPRFFQLTFSLFSGPWVGQWLRAPPPKFMTCRHQLNTHRHNVI